MFDIKLFTEKNIKPSITRIKIFEYIMNGSHPTVEEIYKNLKSELPTLSKTTIYNVLNIFLDNELVSMISTENTEKRYEIKDEKHIHFHCINCDKIYDLPYINIDYSSLESKGFKVIEDTLTIKGICNNCS